MTPYLLAVAAALPWIVIPNLLRKRLEDSTSLDSESAEPSANPPMVSVIVPARNEAHNITQCVRSILGSTYPRFEVVVVNDRSTDETGDIARALAREDARVRVVSTEPLPAGWVGKTWACASGARHAAGDIFCFNDADTMQGSDALVRSVNAMCRRNADLFSVYSAQRLETFWERIVQPHVFTLIGLRYGGTETVTRSSRVSDKIANGQCLFATRAAYDETGGHAAVREYFNEDIMIAQHFFAAGKRVVLAGAIDQVSTRMYTSLNEMINGWGRTLYPGLKLAFPSLGRAGWIAYPVVSVSPLVFELAPVIGILAATVFGLSFPLLLWSVIAGSGMIWWWRYSYRGSRRRNLYALSYPVGAVIVFYIYLRAIFRGRQVSWKGRAYVSE